MHGLHGRRGYSLRDGIASGSLVTHQERFAHFLSSPTWRTFRSDGIADERSLASLQRGGYSARDDTIFFINISSQRSTPTTPKLSSRCVRLSRRDQNML